MSKEKHQHQIDSPKYPVCNYFSCFQLLVARARRYPVCYLEYGPDSWDGPNSGTEHSGIVIQHGHHRSLRTFVGTGRVAIARASVVDPQCVLIFEADLRNPLTRQKIIQT